jgi:hypothetical protein
MGIQLFANNPITTLAANLTASATVMQVASSSEFPTASQLAGGNWFNVTIQTIIDDIVTAFEIVTVTGVAGVNWTIERAQEGTLAAPWVIGNTVALNVTAGGLNAFVQPGSMYPITEAEIAAGAVVMNARYLPGNVWRYGADPTNAADSTLAILAANAQAQQPTGSQVYFPRGLYGYTMSIAGNAPCQIGGAGTGSGWRGEDVYGTQISVIMGSYTGIVFQQVGSTTISELHIVCAGGRQGNGLLLSAQNEEVFTGEMRLTRVWVDGFYYNIEYGNIFEVTLDQVRSEDGAEGLWCVPNNTSGSAGYVVSILHLNCFFNNNARNIHFQPPVNSYSVKFVGGALQDATGAVANAEFYNIFNLSLDGTYGEGNSVLPWIITDASVVALNGLISLTGGPIQILNVNTLVKIDSCQLGNGSPLICEGVAPFLQVVTIDNSILATVGNVYPTKTRIRNSNLNGISPQPLVSGWGAPVGGSVIANYNITDAGGANSNTNKTVAEIVNILLANNLTNS